MTKNIKEIQSPPETIPVDAPLLDYQSYVDRGQFENIPAVSWITRCLGKKALNEKRTFYDQAITGVFNYESTFNKLKELGGFCISSSPSLRGKFPSSVFIWDDTVVSVKVDNNTEAGNLGGMSIYSTNHDRFKTLFDTFNTKITKVKQTGQVHILIPTQSGIDIESLGMAHVPLEEENYRPEVIAGYKQIVNDINAINPTGRLAILNGAPGTGKTYLTRSIIGCSENAVFVILPANMTSDLGGPALISCLSNLKEKDKTIVLIIEDADNALSSRASDNISAISTLLNASDGIIGHLINIRIICTTNADIEDFDEAIIRPGRLSANIEVGLLDAEQAGKVYKRLTGEDRKFTKYTSLGEVYTLAKKGAVMSLVEPKRNAVGFAYNSPPQASSAAEGAEEPSYFDYKSGDAIKHSEEWKMGVESTYDAEE